MRGAELSNGAGPARAAKPLPSASPSSLSEWCWPLRSKQRGGHPSAALTDRSM